MSTETTDLFNKHILIDERTGKGVFRLPIGRLLDDGHGPIFEASLFSKLDYLDFNVLPYGEWSRKQGEKTVITELPLLDGRVIDVSIETYGQERKDGLSIIYTPLVDEGGNLTVIGKNGVVQIYECACAGPQTGMMEVHGVVYLSRLVLPSGRALKFSWVYFQGDLPRLASIEDAVGQILKAKWSEPVPNEGILLDELVLFPDSNEVVAYTCKHSDKEKAVAEQKEDGTLIEAEAFVELNVAGAGILADRMTYRIDTLGGKVNRVDVTSEYPVESDAKSDAKGDAKSEAKNEAKSIILKDTEALTYDSEGRVATYTFSPHSDIPVSADKGYDALLATYKYEKDKTTVVYTQGSVKDQSGKSTPKEVGRHIHQFKEGRLLSVSSVVHGVTTSAEQEVKVDTKRKVSVIRSLKKINGTIVEEVTSEYDVRGNLISLTQGDLVTEWTYFNDYEKYRVEESKERVHEASLASAPFAALDYGNPLSLGNLFFGSQGMTWCTQTHTKVTSSPVGSLYAKDAFQLPLELNYPGSGDGFSAYIESEMVYRKVGDKRHAQRLTYYGYEKFTPQRQPDVSREHVLAPALKLTVLQPEYEVVDVSDKQLEIARTAAKDWLDRLKKEGDAATGKEKETYQKTIDDLNESLKAQSEFNASGFKLKTPWAAGSMYVEALTYQTDTNNPGFGLPQTNTVYLLDEKGEKIADSEITTRFDYSRDAKDKRRITTKTKVKAAGTPEVISSQTRSELTGRLYESTDSEGITTVISYTGKGLVSKEKVTLGSKTLSELDYSMAALNGQSFKYECQDALTKGRWRMVTDVPGRTRVASESTDGTTWYPMTKSVFNAGGRLASVSEYDYDGENNKHSTHTTTWVYDDKADKCTATYVLTDANDTEIDRKTQILETTANSESMTQGAFKMLRQYDAASRTITEIFGATSGAHLKVQSAFTAGGQPTSVKHLKVSVDKDNKPTESEVDRVAFSYNPQGLLEKLTAKCSAPRTYVYDRFGRMTKTILGTVGSIEIKNTYSNSNMAAVATESSIRPSKDEEATILGSQTVDGLGRVSGMKATNGHSANFSYPGGSRWGTRKDAATGPGTLEGYSSKSDDKARKYTETTAPGALSGAESITYFSRRGRVLGFSGVSGEKTQYQYDAFGRLKAAKSEACETVYTYADNGLLEKETITAVKEKSVMTVTYGYDVLGREISRKFECAGFAPLSVERSLLGDGRLSKSTLKVSGKERCSESYEYYPNSNRLMDWKCTGADVPVVHDGRRYIQQQFDYDGLGNVVSSASAFYTTDPKNFSVPSFAYAYDAEKPGVLTEEKADGSVGSVMENDATGRLVKRANRKITYHANGQVKSYGMTDSGEGSAYTFTYDDLGRVRGGSDGNWSDTYHYRGDRIYAVLQEDKKGQHGFKARMMVLQNDSPSCLMQKTFTSGTSSTSFELRDAAGTVFASYDVAKKAVTYYGYLPYGYGKPDPKAVTWLGFKGEPLNSLGLYHLGNGYRLYDPELQRFQTPDSWSPFVAGCLAAYAYCGGDPVNYHDPSGHHLVAQYTRYDSKPLMYSKEFRIGMAVAGVLAAPFTGGTSIAFGAAVTGITAVAAGFEIASVALEDSDPELAQTLGYVGFGVGMASLAGAGLASAARTAGRSALGVSRLSSSSAAYRPGLISKAPPSRIPLPVPKLLRDRINGQRVATPPATPPGTPATVRYRTLAKKDDLGKFELYHQDGSYADHLIISAHGSNAIFGGKVTVPANAELRHYAPPTGTMSSHADSAGNSLATKLIAQGKQVPTKVVPGNHYTSNYKLSHFAHESESYLKDIVTHYRVDILTIKPGYVTSQNRVFSELDARGLHYYVYDASYCRESEVKALLGIPRPNNLLQ